MNPLARLARRGQRPAVTPPVRLGGADDGPGALSTLVRDPASDVEPIPGPPVRPALPPVAEAPVERPRPRPGRSQEARTSPWRLLGRLVLVVVVGLVTFHHSVGSLLHAVAGGSVVAYVLAVPLYAGLAAAAGARRPGYQVAPGARVRDVLLGAVTCLAALGASTLLGPGLSGVYGLWRLDLLMLWAFLLGAAVLSFGLRQVGRSWPFWVVLLLLWPFPVRLANSALSGAVGGASLLLLVVLAVVALGHRPGDPRRWRVLGSTAAAGLVVLALSGLTTHPQRLPWASVVAAGVAAAWWAAEVRRGPLATVVEHRVRGTVPVLVLLALVGVVALPAAPRTVVPSSPTGLRALSLGSFVVPGFTTTATSTSKAQQRFFGRTSSWQRITLRQGDVRLGPTPGGRDVVVDVVSTPRPQALELYPVVTTYPMGTLSATPDAEVDLGHGVTGQLFRTEDAGRAPAFTLLTFSWRLPVDMGITGGYTGPSAPLTQRITLIAVDDHREGATFPGPTGGTLDGIKAAVDASGTPRTVRSGSGLPPDEQLLDDAARALVHQRLTGG